MKRLVYSVITLFALGTISGQDNSEPTEVIEPEEQVIEMVEMEFEDASFFVESSATSLVKLPDTVEYPTVELEDYTAIRLLDYRVLPGKPDEPSVVEVRWYPVSEGLTTFPAIEVSGDSILYRTNPSQILVRSPVKSPDIDLVFKPAKTTVHVGEPLRVDVIWSSNVSTKRIRSLECYPALFNNPDLEFTIPRSTDPESKQLGIPFGGRRIIARRDADPENAQILGTVSFPVYIRFSEPGMTSIPSARLQCAQLHQDGGPLAPYAAYYNNGLFEDIEKGVTYDKIFTDSVPVEIEVLPLPEEGRSESFSGLFMPCEIKTSISPTEANVGQLMDLDIVVNSPFAADFLQLPPLTTQKSLRSWFKIDPDYTRTWLPDGSQFSARIRALTTKVKAIPSLDFQVFDPASGTYRTLETPAIQISIQPQDGKDYFDSKVLLDTSTSLTSQDEGIWNNRGTTKMHDFLDTLLGITGNYFWLLMASGPIIFLVALPRVLESRRRERDPVYKRQIEAYSNFQKLPEGDVRKWNSLKEMIAVSLSAEPNSWTVGDSLERLQEVGVDEETIQTVCECHRIVDSEDFSTSKPHAELPALKPIGQGLFKLLRNISVIVFLAVMTLPVDLMAQDWQSAESEFSVAKQQEAGSPEYYAAFSKAALQFESVAKSGSRPGLAWYNAGNAWFFAGEIGRAIACYKYSASHRPFDPLVKENLAAARALAIDVVETGDTPIWLSWPIRWVGFILVVLGIVFWALFLGYARYRSRPLLSLTAASLLLVILFASLGFYQTVLRTQPGVVVVPEIYGRKGPGYNYHTAFYEPLHDGLEFELIEVRKDWLSISLTDGRTCWIPKSQGLLIDLSL